MPGAREIRGAAAPHGTNEWGPDANRGSYVHIYAMSDIHGCLDAFKASLSTVDLDVEDSKLVLLGDYCDRGPDSLGVFELVMDLQKRYGDRVVALRGNHEEMFLEYIDEVKDLNFTQAWILADSNLATAKSFLDAEAFKHVKHLLRLRKFEEAYAYTVERIKAEHADIIAWVRKLPYFYESPFGQVFVHAGVDEEAGEDWKLGTSVESLTMMPPDYVGREFYLDVIAGHINTEAVSGIAGYRGIWHDGASHYYIDGNVMKNGEVAVLSYDSETGKYSGPGLE